MCIRDSLGSFTSGLVKASLGATTGTSLEVLADSKIEKPLSCAEDDSENSDMLLDTIKAVAIKRNGDPEILELCFDI